MVQLVQVVLAGEDGAVGDHLGQDAADGPHVYGLGVALPQCRGLLEDVLAVVNCTEPRGSYCCVKYLAF